MGDLRFTFSFAVGSSRQRRDHGLGLPWGLLIRKVRLLLFVVFGSVSVQRGGFLVMSWGLGGLS